VSADKLRRPVTAIRQLDYEFAVYLALKPSEKRRLKERRLRRRLSLTAVVAMGAIEVIVGLVAGR